MAKKKKEAGKNKKLDELLKSLDIETDKRDKIMEFVETLTFNRIKELSMGKSESEESDSRLRLKKPWEKEEKEYQDKSL